MEKLKKVKNFITSKTFILLVICILLFVLLIAEFFFFKDKVEKAKKNPYEIEVSPTDNFVFLGDSITEYYPLQELFDGLPVVNSGVAGYTTEDILNVLDTKVPIYNPTKVFILIGTNDLKYGKSNEEIVNNIKTIVERILEKRPETKIYIESIYPINNTDNEQIEKEKVGIRANENIQLINKELKKYCKDNNYVYIDMYSELVDKDGNLDLKYTTEGLHISDLGYLKITKVLYEYLND